MALRDQERVNETITDEACGDIAKAMMVAGGRCGGGGGGGGGQAAAAVSGTGIDPPGHPPGSA